jgi:phosphoglycerate kinase
VLLPQDIVCAHSIADPRPCCTLPVTTGGSRPACVPDDAVGVDIGPKTRSAYAAALQGCSTVFWNGPLGVCEVEAFGSGTEEVAFSVGQLARGGATTVVGGTLHNTSLRLSLLLQLVRLSLHLFMQSGMPASWCPKHHKQ